MDIGLIICVSPLLIVIVIPISLWILLVSGRPLLFRQQRIGILGKPFICYKFRTMRVDADTTLHEDHAQRLIDSDAPMVKMDLNGDSRLIPFALPIRCSGLDELPQLLNVLKGEMSLVGPRPCLPCEYEKYQPWQRQRFDVTPGLTGLWQVSGKNRTTFTEMVQMDIFYGRTRSFMLDSKILLMTLPVLGMQIFELARNKITPKPKKRTGLVPQSNKSEK